MIEKLGEFFSSFPGEIYVFLISLLPLAELRAAIPVGAALGLPFYLNYPLALVGNILPVPFILIFIPKLLNFLGRFRAFAPMTEWLRRKAYKNWERIVKKSDEIKASPGGDVVCASGGEDTEEKKKGISAGIFTAMMLFVALPIPGTGAWTGALVASLFGLPKRMSFGAIFIGVAICGVIMCLASYGVVGFLSFLI